MQQQGRWDICEAQTPGQIRTRDYPFQELTWYCITEAFALPFIRPVFYPNGAIANRLLTEMILEHKSTLNAFELIEALVKIILYKFSFAVYYFLMAGYYLKYNWDLKLGIW